METRASAPSKPGRRMVWAGRIVGALPLLFLLMDAIMKLIRPLPAPVYESALKLGYAPKTMPIVGSILLSCLILYAIPRTAVLGAILLTGYLGGAVATNLRVGNPLFGYVLFPVYVGVLIWCGLFLRYEQVRELVPFRH
jgi:DoxX-like protein